MQEEHIIIQDETSSGISLEGVLPSERKSVLAKLLPRYAWYEIDAVNTMYENYEREQNKINVERGDLAFIIRGVVEVSIMIDRLAKIGVDAAENKFIIPVLATMPNDGYITKFSSPTIVKMNNLVIRAPVGVESRIKKIILRPIRPTADFNYDFGIWSPYTVMASRLPFNKVFVIAGKKYERDGEYEFDVEQCDIVLDYLITLYKFLKSQAAADIVLRSESAIQREQKEQYFPTNPPITDIPKDQIFVGEISDLIGVNLRGLNTRSVMIEVIKHGLLDVWIRAETNGRNDKKVRDALAVNETLLKRIAGQKKERSLALKQIVEATETFFAIKKILGNRADEFKNVPLAQTMMSKLSKEEADKVKFELKRRAEERSNKCDHLGAVNAYREAVLEKDRKRLLKEVLAFNSSKHEHKDHFLECRECGHSLICPHVLAMQQSNDYSQIKHALTPYIDKKNVSKEFYFCRICGEALVALEILDVDVEYDDIGEIDEDVKRLLWHEIMDAMNIIDFGKTPVDRKKIIVNARNIIYKYVQPQFDIIQKIQTDTETIKEKKRRLFMSIYAYAYFTYMVIKNEGTLSLKISTKGGKDRKLDISIAVLTYIKDRKTVMISETGQQAKDIDIYFTNAYKKYRDSNLVVDKEDLVTKSDIKEFLNVNPIYQWLIKLRKLESGKLIVPDEDEILGQKLGDALKDDGGVFAKVKWPDSKLSALQKKQIELIKHRIATYRDENAIPVSVDPPQSRNSDSYEKYLKMSASLIETENAKKSANMSAHPIFAHKFSKPGRKYKFKVAPLSNIYDERGRPHKWTIYVTEAGSEIKKGKGGKKDTKIVDRKCEICGILESETHKLDEQKISDALNMNANIDNLFRFYELRCPEGESHSFEGGKCTRCEKPESTSSDATKAASYYEKYKVKFNQERQHMKAIRNRKRDEPTSVAPETVNTAAATYEKWSFELDNVIALSTLANQILKDTSKKEAINQHTLMMIGASEGNLWNATRSETFIPVEPPIRGSTRAYKIASYIRMVIMDYNRLRKGGVSLDKSSRDISDLIEEKMGKTVFVSVASSFKEDILDEDFSSAFKYFLLNKKPKEVIDFCIDYLCRLLLAVLSDDIISKVTHKTTTQTLRQAFVMHELMKIFKSDSMIAKPGQFNWSAVFAKNENADDATAVVEDEGDVVNVAEDGDDDEGVFTGYKNFDMEDSLAVEGDDPNEDMDMANLSNDYLGD